MHLFQCCLTERSCLQNQTRFPSHKALSETLCFFSCLSSSVKFCSILRQETTKTKPRNLSLGVSKLREMVKDREAWRAASPWGCKELDMTEQPNSYKDLGKYSLTRWTWKQTPPKPKALQLCVAFPTGTAV